MDESIKGWPSSARRGFTLVELCVCLASGLLLLALALPALAISPARGQVAECLNNLRLMGRAVEMFASDHVNEPSWRTDITDGGTRPTSGVKPGAACVEFTALSNELATPRILACPEDTGVKVASEFSGSGTGGYMATGFRNLATSYCIILDNPSGGGARPLFSDRNLRFNGTTLCVIGINNADRFNLNFNQGEWTNAVHGTQGNVVRTDGSVVPTSTEEFRSSLRFSDDSSSVHFLRAR